MPKPGEKNVSIGSMKVVPKGDSVEVTVTSGTLTGRTARLITVPPSGAYFNDSTQAASGEKSKKRA